ncbi:MAG: glycerol kinase GlpK [Spirochaetales bacterium]|nr:glycerol kinase GlpK [Spirochaetales bacterium]
MMKEYILAMDQGTTSSRAIIFNRKSEVFSTSQIEFRQMFPKPGWVEHDPAEILKTQIDAAKAAIEKGKVPLNQIAAIGIANQRETTILWEKNTGKAVYNAIVWQCRRTTELCRELKQQGMEQTIREKTGLLIDPYFSGTKVMWMLKQVPGLMQRAEKGEICFGTVDSWLLYHLTGNHSTDPSNASRTLLYNIHKGCWDDDLCKLFGIPMAILPAVLPSSGNFGITKKEIFGVEIPVCGIAGDQQAALFGQGCFSEGSAKNTYGTGCFALLHTGKRPVVSRNNLLTTIAWDRGKGFEYALEGSVFIAGAAIQWLRDSLKIINSTEETGEIAKSISDTGGVYFVPAFVGMGAPYWDPGVRGTILGLTRGNSPAHIVRAALESIAYQTRDLFSSMEKDRGKPVTTLRVDGGASKNDFLMQFQADILGIPIERPRVFETTALGAAYLAGLSTGIWDDIDEISKNWKCGKSFSPEMQGKEREEKLINWEKAVKAARMFV